jgi:hypothetical protein
MCCMCTEKTESSFPLPNSSLASSEENKNRIQTQIHRRKKGKAVLPMKDEWDDQSQIPPNLRRPSSEMKKNQ